jgi:hypothetical protein
MLRRTAAVGCAAAALLLASATAVLAQDHERELHELNDSGVSGNVSMTIEDGELMVELDADGLMDDARHAVQLRSDGQSCRDWVEGRLTGADDASDHERPGGTEPDDFGMLQVELTDHSVEDGQLQLSYSEQLPEGMTEDELQGGAVVVFGDAGSYGNGDGNDDGILDDLFGDDDANGNIQWVAIACAAFLNGEGEAAMDGAANGVAADDDGTTQDDVAPQDDAAATDDDDTVVAGEAAGPEADEQQVPEGGVFTGGGGMAAAGGGTVLTLLLGAGGALLVLGITGALAARRYHENA